MNRKKKDKKMEELLVGFSAYEGSKKAYCELHKIKPHVFDYYKRKLQVAQKGSPAFLPIQIKERPTVSTLTLHYSNGNRIYLSSDTPMSVLVELVQVRTDQLSNHV